MDDACRGAAHESDYLARVARAREEIRLGRFDAALGHLEVALDLREDRPEAYNLLGVVEAVRGDRPGAQRHWRMALLLVPGYRPARENLTRSITFPRPRGALILG